MQNLENCPRCGTLFVKSLRPVCNDCHRAIEEKFQTVYTFIRKRENRSATMMEVVKGTRVEREDITRFIKEGRLHLNQFPNLEYPCESCGKDISEGRICKSCKGSIESGIQAEKREKEREERVKEEERSRYTAYHSLNDRLK
ncbi:TIGR03826 family flagellar region protein [Alteribacillus bidgolensis]|uniref:Flagellar operon protein TIGR03826 n=1 Tax=Alteribacillus bidgolensis TaxID=930129 RepID=A0A1G8E2D5_9BACI|nr:TIGR03826 family flagellar region protein [Alteribacillus bidgolensis]SDH64054.1 flagellar operon protein TIGR03826 [Alteribacillus bidgolensis]